MCNHTTSNEHYIKYGKCEMCQRQDYHRRKAEKSLIGSCGHRSNYGHNYEYGLCAKCKREEQDIRRELVNCLHIHNDCKQPIKNHEEKKIMHPTRKTIPKTL